MPSTSDVARHAGVSSATVSRVLSGSDYPVRAETRQRVLDAATALGFRPNRLARGLVTSRTNIVAAIVHDISDPYFAELARALEDAARGFGYQLLVSSSDRDPERELEWLDVLLSYRVDGLIFASSIIEDRAYQRRLRETLDRFDSDGRAVVRLAPHLSRIPGVTIDHRAAAADLVKHLLQLGHRKIGMLRGPSSLRAARHRFEGYQNALRRADIPLDNRRVVEAAFSSGGGAHAIAELLERAPEVTAVFAANDAMAIGATHVLHQAGISIPMQMSLAGFNDVQLGRYVSPPLTTVNVPIREQANQVFALIAALLRGEEPTSSTLPAVVVPRQSTGPPRLRAQLSDAAIMRIARLRKDAVGDA